MAVGAGAHRLTLLPEIPAALVVMMASPAGHFSRFMAAMPKINRRLPMGPENGVLNYGQGLGVHETGTTRKTAPAQTEQE